MIAISRTVSAVQDSESVHYRRISAPEALQWHSNWLVTIGLEAIAYLLLRRWQRVGFEHFLERLAQLLADIV